MMAENFRARDIGLRTQKKLLSRMASKNVAKVFIDETAGQLLDNLYRLVKYQVRPLSTNERDHALRERRNAKGNERGRNLRGGANRANHSPPATPERTTRVTSSR